MLTVRQHQALTVLDRHWRYAGARDAYIREHLGWTPTRHAQVVTALLDDPEAEREYPQLVRRLRRLRDARAAVRRPMADSMAD